MSNETTSQTIEELQQRFQSLSDQKIKVETQREHALTQLNELKSQAMELYGSDDVEQLKKILEEMKSSNEVKRREYQSSLDAIDSELAEINEKHNTENQE